MTDHSRIRCRALTGKVMSAEQAAAFIRPGENVGMSGFTGAGYPKAVPGALVDRVTDATVRGERFAISVWTGASTAPELDGALAAVDGIDLRMPYQSDPVSRAKINAGLMDYLDLHLSHVAQMVWEGFFGHLDVAVVEVAGITEDGSLIPSSSVGNNKTWIDQADRVILEVNSWQPAELEGMHDIYYGTALPPHRNPLQIVEPSDRIGVPYLRCPPEKIVAIVPTHAPDRNSAFKPIDHDSQLIASNVLEFLTHEVKQGRLPKTLLPLQSGVGNIANAVLNGLDAGPFRPLTAYTEVIQDGMLQLLRSGTLSMVSATAFSLSDEGLDDLRANIADYRDRIILRPQEISNHPEVIRRLGCLAMNGMIEADIYGNVNSTHVMGSSIQNGIGGSGDFARNAYVAMFLTPSTAKNGAISCIVPMASHVDHTEHDVHVLVTEQGVADLRGLPPRRRAQQIIDHCAHPDYRPALQDYLDRATASNSGKHTPHLLDEALSWHVRYLQNGTMQPA
ncbi:MAG TPA: acetyl-CoA hydrolase/transferase family protein [Dermatophilaceae bacterium]